jgi:hypothetical protein
MIDCGELRWHSCNYSDPLEGNKPSNISSHQIAVPRCVHIVFFLLLLMLPTSCSHRSAISRAELSSIVRSSISLTSETEMSLDYVAEGRSTRNFTSGHFRYIAREVEQNVRQLSESRPSPGIEQEFRNSEADVKELESELTTISSQAINARTISAAKQRITEIRGALEKTSASL